MSKNIDKNNENIEEKANSRLQGKVKQSSLEYISAMEGTFAEKIQELIAIHETKSDELVKLRTRDRVESIERAMQIMKNSIANIETEANLFVEGYRNQVENRIADIVEQVVEQDKIKQQYEDIKAINEKLEAEASENKINIVELKANIKILEEAKNELINQNNALLNREIKAISEIKSITAEKDMIIEQLRADITTKTNTINTLEKSQVMLEQIKLGNEDSIKQLREQLEANTEQYKANIEELKASNTQTIKQYEDTIKSLENNNKQTIEQYKSTIGAIEDKAEKTEQAYKTKIEKIEADKIKIEEDARLEVQAIKNVAEKKLTEIEEENKAKLEEKNIFIKKLQDDLVQAQESNKTNTRELIEANKTIAEVRNDINIRDTKINDLESEIQELKNTIEKLKAKKNTTKKMNTEI